METIWKIFGVLSLLGILAIFMTLTSCSTVAGGLQGFGANRPHRQLNCEQTGNNSFAYLNCQ